MLAESYPCEDSEEVKRIDRIGCCALIGFTVFMVFVGIWDTFYGPKKPDYSQILIYKEGGKVVKWHQVTKGHFYQIGETQIKVSYYDVLENKYVEHQQQGNKSIVFISRIKDIEATKDYYKLEGN